MDHFWTLTLLILMVKAVTLPVCCKEISNITTLFFWFLITETLFVMQDFVQLDNFRFGLLKQ